MGAGRPKSIDNTKVFDVAKPGKSKPVSTSRPVIVNHSMAVRDASVVTGTDDTNTTAISPTVTRKIISPITIYGPDDIQEKPKTSITIIKEPIDNMAAPELTAVKTAPLTEETEVEDIKEPAKTEAAEVASIEPALELVPEITSPEATAAIAPEAADETEAAETVEQKIEEVPATKQSPETVTPSPEEQKKVIESPIIETNQPATTDAVAEPTDQPTIDQKAAEDEIKRDTALQELINSRKYVVPLAHDSTKRSGHKNLFYIFFFIFLLATLVYLAIDSKLLKTSINLPYHLFKR